MGWIIFCILWPLSGIFGGIYMDLFYDRNKILYSNFIWYAIVGGIILFIAIVALFNSNKNRRD